MASDKLMQRLSSNWRPEHVLLAIVALLMLMNAMSGILNILGG